MKMVKFGTFLNNLPTFGKNGVVRMPGQGPAEALEGFNQTHGVHLDQDQGTSIASLVFYSH
jgi:hypothetical protein